MGMRSMRMVLFFRRLTLMLQLATVSLTDDKALSALKVVNRVSMDCMMAFIVDSNGYVNGIVKVKWNE